MNVLTKNYGIENGERKYLTYLMDDDKPLECIDSKGEVERSGIEMELLNKHNLTIEDLTYMTLEEYYRQELKKDEPLIMVFYLDRGLWEDRQMVATYGENVKKYFDSTGDDVRLFFLPTDNEERIECINPVYITEQKDKENLNKLTDNLETLFQVGTESILDDGEEDIIG